MAKRFPRSAKYNPDWVLAGVSGAAHPLWMAEWLAEAMDLRPGMRVLDLGCGRALSSIFLRREFAVQVWATDLWFDATENWRRIQDAGADDGVFPIHADARQLPFPAGFFDAVVSLDSFFYYGTDDLYLIEIARLLKAGGAIGIAGAGLMQEIDGEIPAALKAWWAPETWCLHGARWWRRHWERTGILDVAVADAIQDGWKIWLDWHRKIAPDNATEIDAITADAGRTLGYVRVVARLRPGAKIPEPARSIATQYTKLPLFLE